MAKVENTSDACVLVGIDISKHRHEVLIAVPGKTRRRRLTITNSADDFIRLIGILREYGMPVRIGFEATGNYHRVAAFAREWRADRQREQQTTPSPSCSTSRRSWG